MTKILSSKGLDEERACCCSHTKTGREGRPPVAEMRIIRDQDMPGSGLFSVSAPGNFYAFFWVGLMIWQRSSLQTISNMTGFSGAEMALKRLSQMSRCGLEDPEKALVFRCRRQIISAIFPELGGHLTRVFRGVVNSPRQAFF
ncbi:hypothetical protein [Pedobacter yulinensis]|nr:hypothetical protein [Pedobacter yulinensis]